MFRLKETKRNIESKIFKFVNKTKESKGFLERMFSQFKGIDIYEKDAAKILKSHATYNMLKLLSEKDYDSIVVICIGTTAFNCIGDRVGPMVGSMLKDKEAIEGVHIYGTITQPLNKFTIDTEIRRVFQEHKNPFIIGIDCAVTPNKKMKDRIFVSKTKLRPGAALDKNAGAFGNIAVHATLVHGSRWDSNIDILKKLARVDYNIVESAATVISKGMHNALREVTQQGVFLFNNKE